MQIQLIHIISVNLEQINKLMNINATELCKQM